MRNNRNPLASSTLITWMISGVILIVAAYFVFYSAGIKPESLSHFGSFFGGIATGIGVLFAGFGFYIQQKESKRLHEKDTNAENFALFSEYITEEINNLSLAAIDSYKRGEAIRDKINVNKANTADIEKELNLILHSLCLIGSLKTELLQSKNTLTDPSLILKAYKLSTDLKRQLIHLRSNCHHTIQLIMIFLAKSIQPELMEQAKSLEAKLLSEQLEIERLF